MISAVCASQLMGAMQPSLVPNGLDLKDTFSLTAFLATMFQRGKCHTPHLLLLRILRGLLEMSVCRSYTTTIRRLTSPVFFSTAADGRVQRGLSNLPDARPMLLVGNHQTFALDLGLMVEQIVRERGFLPRGLAHPAIFGVRCRTTLYTPHLSPQPALKTLSRP